MWLANRQTRRQEANNSPFCRRGRAPSSTAPPNFLPIDEIREFKNLLSQSVVKCPAIEIDAAPSKRCNPSLPLFPFAFLRNFELQTEEIPDTRAQLLEHRLGQKDLPFTRKSPVALEA